MNQLKKQVIETIFLKGVKWKMNQSFKFCLTLVNFKFKANI